VNTVILDAPFAEEVPVGVVCQNQLVPPAGEPFLVIVTPMETHCGLLLNGTFGAKGSELIVTEFVVVLHPVRLFVKVNVTLPAETPVTTPAFVIVAIAGLLLIQVPPEVGVKVTVLPRHNDAGEVTIGSGLTLIVPVAVATGVHPPVVVIV
jgi:hypothetical protein